MIRHRRTRSVDIIPVFLGEIASYRDAFYNRILPAFSQIEKEAEAASEQEHTRLSSRAGPDSDEAQIAEKAYFHGVDLYLTTRATTQGVVNLMVAGLYHLFEQHAQRVLMISTGKYTKDCTDLVGKVLKSLGVEQDELEKSGCLKTIQELRFVANTVKHGEGDSCKKLHELRPALFEMGLDIDGMNRIPAHPMTGEGLYLKQEDFERYANGLLSFWKGIIGT